MGTKKPVRSDTRRATGFFTLDGTKNTETTTPASKNSTSSEETSTSPQKTCKAVSESEMFKQDIGTTMPEARLVGPWTIDDYRACCSPGRKCDDSPPAPAPPLAAPAPSAADPPVEQSKPCHDSMKIRFPIPQESQKSDDDGSSSGFGSDEEEDDEYEDLFKLARENMLGNQAMVKAAREAYEAAPPMKASIGENGTPLLPFATKKGSHSSLSDTPRDVSPKANPSSAQPGSADLLAPPSAPVDDDASSFGSTSDGEAQEEEERRQRKEKHGLMGSPAAAAVAFAGFPATAPPAGPMPPRQARTRGNFDDVSSFASSSDEEEKAAQVANEAPKAMWGVSSGSTSPSLAVGSGCAAAKLLRKDVVTPCSSFGDSDSD